MQQAVKEVIRQRTSTFIKERFVILIVTMLFGALIFWTCEGMSADELRGTLTIVATVLFWVGLEYIVR